MHSDNGGSERAVLHGRCWVRMGRAALSEERENTVTMGVLSGQCNMAGVG